MAQIQNHLTGTVSPEIKSIYTEREAAETLRISQPTLKRIRYHGDISFLRIGSQVRYLKVHLEDYLLRSECCR